MVRCHKSNPAMGMGEAWTKQQWTTEEHKQWNRQVWKAINQKEEQQWKEHMMQENKTEN